MKIIKKLLKKKKNKLSNHYNFKKCLLYFYLNLIKNRFVLISILDLYIYFSKFLLKLFFFNLWYKLELTFRFELFNKVQKLISSELVLKNFSLSIFDKISKRFSMFNFFIVFKDCDLLYLQNLKHFSKFLYKFSVYRELSFICQFLFNKIFIFNYKSFYYLNSKLSLSISWEFIIKNFNQISVYKDTVMHRKNLKLNILLEKSKFKFLGFDIKKFSKYIMSTIFFYNNIFSFGYKKEKGSVSLINFVLFIRRIYLDNFKCIKNLIWVNLRSNKTFKIDGLWSYLNYFKKLNFSNFNINFIFNYKNFFKFKIFLLRYFKEGLFHKHCCIDFNDWLKQLFYLFIHRYIMPSSINNDFEIFLNSFTFLLLSYINFAYDFFNFLFNVFSILQNKFNFYGLPGLFDIKNMVYKLRPKKKKKLLKKGFWFNDTNVLLKNKYKNLKIWSLWKNYNYCLNFSKELTLKNFLKFNKIYFNYYLKFFKDIPKLKKKNLDFFIILESRIDILLYRLGFSHDLNYLRFYINKGWFLVEHNIISFISYYVSPKSLVQPTIRSSINIFNQLRLYNLSNIRNKQYLKPWYKSKIYFLRYVEFDLLKFAFILIRFPKFGEITYINGFNKFSKKRFPLFENIKSKHIIFSKLSYFKLLRIF